MKFVELNTLKPGATFVKDEKSEQIWVLSSTECCKSTISYKYENKCEQVFSDMRVGIVNMHDPIKCTCLKNGLKLLGSLNPGDHYINYDDGECIYEVVGAYCRNGIQSSDEISVINLNEHRRMIRNSGRRVYFVSSIKSRKDHTDMDCHAYTHGHTHSHEHAHCHCHCEHKILVLGDLKTGDCFSFIGEQHKVYIVDDCFSCSSSQIRIYGMPETTIRDKNLMVTYNTIGERKTKDCCRTHCHCHCHTHTHSYCHCNH